MFFVQSNSTCLSQNDSVNLQAVMESDFSVSQFQFLERLLGVHGHCYKRDAQIVIINLSHDSLYHLYALYPPHRHVCSTFMLGYSLFVVSLDGFFCF